MGLGQQINQFRNNKNLASIQHLFYDKRIDMETVTLSSKFQIVIPQAVRERMKLSPGERFRVIGYGDRVELIPVRPVREMRGKFPHIDPDIEREDDRL